MDAIFIPYTYLELMYVENLIPVIDNATSLKNEIILNYELTRFSIRNFNIFHFFAHSPQLLSSIMTTVNRQDFIEPGVKDDYFGILMKNQSKKSAFDIAVFNESPKCIELFLSMLNERGNF